MYSTVSRESIGDGAAVERHVENAVPLAFAAGGDAPGFDGASPVARGRLDDTFDERFDDAVDSAVDQADDSALEGPDAAASDNADFLSPGDSGRAMTSTGRPPVAAGTGRATLAQLRSRIGEMQGTRLDSRILPTHPAIAALLPGGGLMQGASYSVSHSATLLMALLAGPSAAGSWCGVIGVPDFGVEAAARYGIDLERLVLVPHPGDHWLTVTAAIADVMSVVVMRPPARASDTSIARLSARLRQRGSTLIVLGPWPQTDAMLSISRSSWTGIGIGHGHLAAREATITVSTRAGGRPRSTTLWLPDRAEKFTTSGNSGQQQVPDHQWPTELAG